MTENNLSVYKLYKEKAEEILQVSKVFIQITVSTYFFFKAPKNRR